MNREEIFKDQKKLLEQVHDELQAGFNVLSTHPKTVTFFGSARLKEKSVYYVIAKELGSRVVKELGYSVITGGGPGIMEAVSWGASDAGGKPIGMTIRLPREQRVNPYVKEEIICNHFLTRKTIMTFAAEAWVFFPGGFGTFDELFSILTLVQNGKVPAVPIILFGSEFWKPLDDLIKNVMLEKYGTVGRKDVDIYTITDDEDQVIDIIRNAPVRVWWTDGTFTP